ncbi:MAG: prenyltransferase [Pseudomonadota bacterium]
MSQLAKVFGSTRPNFLVLTPMCVLLGAGAAQFTHGPVDWATFALALLGGLLAHASVNLLNEYEDYSSGLDAMTERTPFSGGTGILPANPDVAPMTRLAGIATLAGTAAIGIYFTARHGMGLLPLGLLGCVVIAAYTSRITHSWIACLIAPGLGFGPLMVMGTAFVLTGEYTPVAFAASLTPFFLVSNLLLLNQFPDVEPDRRVGRRHLLVVGGPKTAARVYVLFLALAFIVPVGAIVAGYLPAWAALGLVPGVLVPVLATKVLSNAEHLESLLPALGLNVVLCLITPLLLAIGLFLA